MPKPVKKNALFPLAYDEVSLVDDGAAGSAHVLITKRTIKKDRGPIHTGAPPPPHSSGSGTFNVVRPPKKKKKGVCASCGKENGTGAKTGDSSNRAKNWKEERHPRDEKGKMKGTDKKSKSAHGKGGTTQAKLDRKCKNCRKKKKDVKKNIVGRKQKFQDKGRPVVKSAMSSAITDAHVLAIMERK